jgi:uncharacterized protein (TIGR02145 family)
MSKTKTKCLMFLIAFFGCTEIPDELREDAKSEGRCGNSIYNPSTSFCYEGNVYAKCDGIKYNPSTQICQGIAVTAAICGGSSYNPLEQRCFNNAVEIKCGTGGYYYNTSTQFCNGNSVYNKCGGREYDPSDQRCESDVVKTRCGTYGYYYDASTQFCYDNRAYDKCGGKTYNPSDPNQRCQSNVIETKCGSDWYNSETRFCSDNSVYDRCNGKTYNPSNQKCESYVVVTKCGTNVWYDAANENLRCQSNVVQTKCGGDWYNPSNQRCQSDVVETRCGTSSDYYTPSTQFCTDNKVYDKCGGQTYTPSSQRCGTGGIIETKCGTSSDYYVPSTQFCSGNSIYDRCNGQTYTPSSQRCANNVVETQCGGNWYALNSNQRCQSNIIETQCGSDWYDTSNSNQRCANNVVETKCGTNWYNRYNYNPSTQFCQVGTNAIKYLCGTAPYVSTEYCSNGTVKTYGTVSDGVQNYKTVVIGTQTWMAENLNYNASGSKCYAEGISGVSADSIAKNCAKYGRLYNWSTAMNGAGSSSANPSNVKGVCPSGWHLPSNAEWTTLTDFVGGSSTAGTKLKAASGWNIGGNGTDDYGFSALPGGVGDSDGSFYSVGYDGRWWSATESSAYSADNRIMSYGGADVYSYYNGKSYFYSVRCVQDKA